MISNLFSKSDTKSIDILNKIFLGDGKEYFIKKKIFNLYLKKDNTFTEDKDMALSFKSSGVATTHAIVNKIADYEIVN